MLFKLSGTSASSILKDITTKDEAYSYLQNALLHATPKSISLGILFCRQFCGNLCSGTASDGSRWGFSVFSAEGEYQEKEIETFEHKDLEYDLRRADVKIKYFDMVLHHRFESCGCDSYRMDLCLPREWCSKITKVTALRYSSEKKALVGEIIAGIILETAKLSPAEIKGISLDNHVH